MKQDTIALDMDSTLAATCDVSFALLEGDQHSIDYEDIEDWDWGLEKYGTYRYLSALWHAWTIRPQDIEPMERGVANVVQRLSDQYEIHIVTAHPDHSGITESKKEWLDRHSIPFDNFITVPMSRSKAEWHFPLYVDDKPGLAENISNDSTLYLRDQRYNRQIDTGEYSNVHRVRTVAEAANKILRE